MSRKSFISAEEHLAKFGVTVAQAYDFIVANVEQPDVIYITARLNGVTNSMLSEMTNISTTVINDYFVSAGRDPKQLDYTSMLINYDLGSLESLIGFNDNDGILSNTSLSEMVKPRLDNSNRYEISFDPSYEFYRDDNTYDAEELGVGHLIDVAATNENKESLFFGSLINIFKKFDQSELNGINTYPSDGSTEDFQMLLLEALRESPEPVVWTDEQLAEMVADHAVDIINKFWTNDQVGILDHSYLGLAAM